ncbi:FAD-binding oxidoreductase [Aspergillus fischeri NRRL 181]|uniref:FAD binding domain protein n=1 Tax=Neosartorya fischeri (strain ATCC 1020 / DSM 3700 / CBS 544.65 / FGSC A1164 / JCM 1740 / NRRL 181 / WB 181) TaxID=331117 RepID=A1DK34_NEOFI|nr:FAD binding domain protein [Aspergillus fischeri NRRL 181]EAW17073.1 FAD binding domain protein [Aspergillus fischeri NRRL 181]
MLRFSVFLSAICAIALVQTGKASLSVFEPDNFNVNAALYNLGVDVSTIPALGSLQSLSTESQSACRAACGALSFLYGPSRAFAQNTTAYSNATGSYWSVQQEEVRPYCIFKPSVNTDVSILVLLARYTGCPFAIKSGGHGAFAGASSIRGGITVLLKDMNAITLNDNRSVVSVGPGNVWVQVYSALEPYGLAAIGGRVSTIGVGGLTTGGGISYYSNLYGWACDNVESFEVVTASGAIVIASADSYPDLYWALRGGGNNFGIVTKFNLYTIPSPEMRGGTRVFAEDQFSKVISAFVSVVNGASDDGNAQHWVAFVHTQGQNVAAAEITYVKNVSEPAIFAPYRAIPAIQDTTAVRTLVEYCDVVQEVNPDGLREMYWTLTVHLDEDFANWVTEYFYSVLPQVLGIQGINPSLVNQGITIPMLKNMTRNGGNALGLDASEGPFHLLLMSTWWENADDDEKIVAWAKDFWDTVTAKAKKDGVFRDYVYMNYASQYQDVIAGYGTTNKAKLQSIAAKYDPKGIYQTLQPGYFKLDGAPASDSL